MPHYFFRNFNLLQNKAPKELDTLCVQVEILKQNPSVVFVEILKQSSTVKRKLHETNISFLIEQFMVFILPHTNFKIQWLNARTGEREKMSNGRHFGMSPTFVFNLLR